MKKNTTLSAVLFKIANGQRTHVIEFNSSTDIDAVRQAYSMYMRMGLIGRYYLETSTGRVHQINSNI